MRIHDKKITLDDLQNGYYIYQAEDEFRFGIDAVFLSDFVASKPREKILDLGTGNGIIPILLAAKKKGEYIFGLEIQKNSVLLANKSVEYNHLQDKISIVEGDIRQASFLFKNQSIEVIVSNPPYMIENHGLRNEREAKCIARHEILCTFEDIVREASKILKNKGRFYFIHRPFRLTELMITLAKYKLEPKRLRFVHPYADKKASMVLIEALKGGNPGVRVEKPLIVYKKSG